MTSMNVMRVKMVVMVLLVMTDNEFDKAAVDYSLETLMKMNDLHARGSRERPHGKGAQLVSPIRRHASLHTALSMAGNTRRARQSTQP